MVEMTNLMDAADKLAEQLKKEKESMDAYKFAELLADCNDLIKRKSGIDYGATCSGGRGGTC